MVKESEKARRCRAFSLLKYRKPTQIQSGRHPIMWIQKEIQLKPKLRGFHLITDELLRELPELRNIKIGMMNVFIMHTSASLTLNENADPTVRQDFESFFNRSVPEDEPYYRHRDE